MTERFIVDDCGTLIDMHTRDMFDIVEEVCPLLNEQHETIQRLKQNIDELLCVNVEEELLKENEQLRTKNNAYIQDIEVFKEENTHLKLENEQLQHDATILIQSNQDYRKENEQLKQAYSQLKHRHSLLHDVCIDAECDRDSYRKDIASLEKENEQLKHTIKTMMENERTELGQSVLKQLWEQIE